eukprot:6564683-Pyramimonas_sp.AAC.1
MNMISPDVESVMAYTPEDVSAVPKIMRILQPAMFALYPIKLMAFLGGVEDVMVAVRASKKAHDKNIDVSAASHGVFESTAVFNQQKCNRYDITLGCMLALFGGEGRVTTNDYSGALVQMRGM